MSTSKPTNSTLSTTPLKSLLGRLDSIARATGLIQRFSRKFSAEGFLLTLFHAVCHGNASFRAMAVTLAEFQVSSLARQSLHQRFKPKTISFLQAVLASLLIDHQADSLGRMRFSRILVQDSSQFWMNRKNSRHFRAVANKSGETSGAKIDLIMDLQSGGFVDCREAAGSTQDRTLGPRLLDEVREGDLVIRDLGYFDMAGFQRIEEVGAHWISRLHATAEVILNNDKPLEILLQSTVQSTLDLRVQVTAKRHRVRLIAIRLPEEIANRRRQQKKDKRTKNKTSPKKGTLIREGWNLYITDLKDDQCSVEELVRFYEQRWQIEIQFRAIKQSTAMKKAMQRITNRNHLQALMYAVMIFSTLTARVYRMIASTLAKPFCLSIERVANWLSQSLTFLRSLDEILRYDLRHLLHDKRKRKTLRALNIKLVDLN